MDHQFGFGKNMRDPSHLLFSETQLLPIRHLFIKTVLTYLFSNKNLIIMETAHDYGTRNLDTLVMRVPRIVKLVNLTFTYFIGNCLYRNIPNELDIRHYVNNIITNFRYPADPVLTQKNYMNRSVPLCNLSNLQLRFLCRSDITEVRALCQDWFPIEYPYTWYEDITSNPRFYSLAAVYEDIIIGIIVAEIKFYSKLKKEDKDILASSFGKSCSVGYILSLGVSEKHRRNGIASLLLENLVCHLTAPDNVNCKAIFLHVLTANSAAIHFYEHRHFRLHSFLPYYYSINGKCKDGFTYVLYINGGHPPWGICDYIRHGGRVLCQLDLCSWIHNRLQAALAWLWPGLRHALVENVSALITH